jgi:hypothetical protein
MRYVYSGDPLKFLLQGKRDEYLGRYSCSKNNVKTCIKIASSLPHNKMIKTLVKIDSPHYC